MILNSLNLCVKTYKTFSRTCTTWIKTSFKTSLYRTKIILKSERTPCSRLIAIRIQQSRKDCQCQGNEIVKVIRYVGKISVGKRKRKPFEEQSHCEALAYPLIFPRSPKYLIDATSKLVKSLQFSFCFIPLLVVSSYSLTVRFGRSELRGWRGDKMEIGVIKRSQLCPRWFHCKGIQMILSVVLKNRYCKDIWRGLGRVFRKTGFDR